MFEYIEGNYRFVGYSHGIVMVYSERVYVDSFNVYSWIDSESALIKEAKEYIDFLKQKY